VKAEYGAANDDKPKWETVTVSMAPFAGQRVRIGFEARDGSPASVVEAAVDDVWVTRN
jgi:hypothetical protein